MKKQVQGVVKQVIRQSLIGYSQSIILLIVTIVFALLVVKNISASQDVPPLYSRVFDDNPKVMVEFLRQIRGTAEYERFAAMAINTYGDTIEAEVNRERLQRKYDISQLEEVLAKNPKARDVLVALAILYRRDDNMEKYEEYKARALVVDPAVVID
jgi:hypothetical protein